MHPEQSSRSLNRPQRPPIVSIVPIVGLTNGMFDDCQGWLIAATHLFDKTDETSRRGQILLVYFDAHCKLIGLRKLFWVSTGPLSEGWPSTLVGARPNSGRMEIIAGCVEPRLTIRKWIGMVKGTLAFWAVAIGLMLVVFLLLGPVPAEFQGVRGR